MLQHQFASLLLYAPSAGESSALGGRFHQLPGASCSYVHCHFQMLLCILL